jgi:hypothetical protein
MEKASEPLAKTAVLLQVCLIFAFGLYLHEAFYFVISGEDSCTGPFRYLIGLELIIFFGHTLGLVTTAFVWLFVVTHSLGGIFIIGLCSPDRREIDRNGALAFVVAVPLLLSTLAAYGIEAWMEKRDLAAPVHQVDLDSQQSAPVLHDGFIELAGWEQRRGTVDFSYVVYSKRHDTHVSIRFVPVVAQGWTPNTPIRYFVRETGVANDIPEPSIKTMETGELGGHLPFYVTRQLKARNLKIDPSYAVIEFRQMDMHHLVDQDTRYWILFCGLFCTGPIAVGTCIFYLMARRKS